MEAKAGGNTQWKKARRKPKSPHVSNLGSWLPQAAETRVREWRKASGEEEGLSRGRRGLQGRGTGPGAGPPAAPEGRTLNLLPPTYFSPPGSLERGRRTCLPALFGAQEVFEASSSGADSPVHSPALVTTQRLRDRETKRDAVPEGGGEWATAATQRGRRGRARDRVSERRKVSVRRKVGGRGDREQRLETPRGAEAADTRTDGSEGGAGREESGILTSGHSSPRAPPLSAPGSPPLSGAATR